MATAICPSCGDDVKLSGRLKIGSEVMCPLCDAELEVIDLEPIELDWAYFEEDDWDDWEDEDEEDDYY